MLFEHGADTDKRLTETLYQMKVAVRVESNKCKTKMPSFWQVGRTVSKRL
jgi:hypothetical protein